MALVDLWKKSRDELSGKRLDQILRLAGSGRLRDDNDCSAEFREFLTIVPTDLLVDYGEQCLADKDKFEDNAFALQDVVNQCGNRLGFAVTNGRYRGVASQVGFDGIWHSPQDKSLIVEVKTTDTYRVPLDVIAGYRRALIRSEGMKEENSSLLIVVGREGTGELEAQIRGSKHAWDIRLISFAALARLVRLKEELETPETIGKIYDILLPREYTRVDGIIDLVFSTAEDARDATAAPEDDDNDVDDDDRPKFVPVNFHEACATRIEKHLQVPLVRLSKAAYANADGSLKIVCAVSREHATPRGSGYWFAFHPHQRELLSKTQQSYVAFGCGSPATLVMIPFVQFERWIEGLNITKTDDRMYWHVHIRKDKKGIFLDRKKGFERIDLATFLL